MTETIYVSPTAENSGNGSKDQPFATLYDAQEALRQRPAPAAGTQADVRVVLLPGVHRLSRTLQLTREDTCDNRRRLTIESPSPDAATLSAGRPLTGWTKWTSPGDEVPASARDRIWSVDLPPGSDINTLFGPDGMILRAGGIHLAGEQPLIALPRCLSFSQAQRPAL